MNTNEFNKWSWMAMRHWEKYLPKMYSRLQEEGTLEKELIEAGRKTLDQLTELEQNGMRQNEAEEVVYPMYIYLTPETSESVPQED